MSNSCLYSVKSLSYAKHDVNAGCEACNGCDPQLRLDSRQWTGFRTKIPLPAALTQGAHFWAQLSPIEGDWRMDPFEATQSFQCPSLYV